MLCKFPYIIRTDKDKGIENTRDRPKYSANFRNYQNPDKFPKIGVTAVKNINQTANEFATIGMSAVQSTLLAGKRQ